jgi:hypothetical protein
LTIENGEWRMEGMFIGSLVHWFISSLVNGCCLMAM